VTLKKKLTNYKNEKRNEQKIKKKKGCENEVFKNNSHRVDFYVFFFRRK